MALMALLFGLARLPGFMLRHAGLEEAIGTNPSPGVFIRLCKRGAVSGRNHVRDRLGANEKSFRGGDHPRGDRSSAELCPVREDVGKLSY